MRLVVAPAQLELGAQQRLCPGRGPCVHLEGEKKKMKRRDEPSIVVPVVVIWAVFMS